MQESFLNSPLMYSIALTLIHFLWQGVLVALALKTLLTFLPNQKSQLRYTLSFVAMGLNLVIPFITFFIIYKPFYLQLVQSASYSPILSLEFTQIIIKENGWYANIADYLPYITVLWLLIVSTLSLKLLVQLHAVNKLPKQNTITPDINLLIRFKTLSEQIGIKKVPTLVLSLNTHVPMAIGWIKPIVLIPVSMLTGLTPTQLDMLILHELAHIRRYDYFVNFLQTIVETILFFHPCVMWVSNQMRNEREYCSDDIAVKHCGDPIAYAHTLADTASLCNKHRNHSIPTMAIAASGGDLTQRVLRLVNQHHCASSNKVSQWFAALSILFVVLFISSQQIFKLVEIELDVINYQSTIEIKDHQLLITSPEIFKQNQVNHDVVQNSYLSEQSTIEKPLIENSVSKQSPAQINKKSSFAKKTPINKPIKIITNTPSNTRITLENTNISTPNTLNKIVDATIKTTLPKSKLVELVIVSPEEKNAFIVKEKPKKDEIEAKLAEIETSTIKKYVSNNTNSLADLVQIQTITKADTEVSPPLIDNLYQNTSTQSDAEPVKLAVNNTHNYGSNYDSLHLYNISQKMVNKKTQRASPQEAELIYSIPPKYPSTAKRKGIELEVKVDFTIDNEGNVIDIIFPAIKHHMHYFKTSVRSAIEKWRFKPAKTNGQAVDSKMSKIFSFSLHEQ